MISSSEEPQCGFKYYGKTLIMTQEKNFIWKLNSKELCARSYIELYCIYGNFYPVLWIRTRPDRHHFLGLRSASRACRSGSVSILTNCKAKPYNFNRKFQQTVQNVENYDIFDVDEKDKRL